MTDENNKRKLYDALSADYDMGSYEKFAQDVEDEGKRRKLYDAIKGEYDLPDYDGFSRQLIGTPQPYNGDFTMNESELGGQPTTNKKQQAAAKVQKPAAQPAQQTTAPMAAAPITTQNIPSVQQMMDNRPQFQPAWKKEEPKPEAAPAATKPSKLSAEDRRAMDASMRKMNLGVEQSGKDIASKSKYIQARSEKPFDIGTPKVELGKTDNVFDRNNPRVVEETKYNPESGKYETTYTNEYGEYDNKAMAQQHQKMKDLERYQDMHPDYAEQANRMQVSSLTQTIDNRLNDLVEKVQKETDPVAYSRYMIATGQPYETVANGYAELTAAKRSLRDAQRIIDEADYNARRGTLNDWLGRSFAGGAARGFGQKFFDIDTWDLGATDLNDAGALMKALKTFDEGKELTDEQMMLLDAKAVELATNAYFGSAVGKGYEAGKVTAESVPFMIEMCLNPASGIGNSAENILARYALRRFSKKAGVKAAEKMAENELKKAAIKAVGKQAVKKAVKPYAIAGRLAGDIVGSAAMAATTGSIGIAADTENRMAGEIKNEYDQYGQSSFSHREGKKGAGEALGEATTARVIENYSEMFGEYFKPILGAAGKGIEKALSKAKYKGLDLSAVSRYIKNMSASDLAKTVTDFEKRAKFSGTIGEYSEEVVGGILNSIFVGDQTLDTDKDTGVFNLENNISTFLGVSLLGGAISSVKAVGYRTAKSRARKNMMETEAIASKMFNNQDKWGQIRNVISVGSDEDIQEVLSEVRKDDSLSEEQKMAAFKFAQYAMQYRGALIAEQEKHNEEPTSMQTDLETSYENGYTLEGQEMNDAKNKLNYERRRIGDIVTDEMLQQLDDDPVAALTKIMNDDAWNEEEKQAALDYVNARATYDGMVQKVQDNIETQTAGIQAELESIGYKEKQDAAPTQIVEVGIVKGTTMNDEPRKGYVISGDYTNDVGSILVMDAETKQMKMMQGMDVIVNSVSSIEETLKQIENEMAQKAVQEARAKINGTLSFAQGDQYIVMDGEGNQHTINIVSAAQEGQVMASVDGAEPVPMSQEEIQQMHDAYNSARLAEYEANKAAKRQEKVEAAQQTTEEQVPQEPQEEKTYSTGDELTLYVDGNPINAQVQRASESEDTYVVMSDDPINGNTVNYFTKAELDALTAMPQAEAPIAEEMPMTEDGKPDYLATTPQRGHQYIYVDSGIEKDVADRIVANKIEQALKEVEKQDEELRKLNENPPDVDEYKQKRDEIAAKRAEAANTLQYWQEVQNTQKAIDAAQAKEDFVKKVEEQQRQEAEAAAEEASREEKTGANESAAPAPTQPRFKLQEQYEAEQDSVATEGGLVKNDIAERILNDNWRGVVHALGRRIGRRIVFVTKEEVERQSYDPNTTRGWYDHNTKTIYINEAFAKTGEDVMTAIAGHEITHALKQENPELWNKFVDYVKEAMGKKEFNKRFNRRKRLYKQHYDKTNAERRAKGEKELAYLTDDEIAEEVCADWAGDNILTDTDTAQKIVSAAEKAGMDAMSIIDKVRKWIDIVLDYINVAEFLGEKSNAQKAALERAKEVWQAMYNVAAIRNEERDERLGEAGINVDAKRGDARMSVHDMLDEDEERKVIDDLMRVTGRSEKTVRQWLKAEQSLAKVILDDDNVTFLDIQADESVPSIWKNSDYPQGTVEFSNICRKRLPLTMIYQRLQQEFPNRVFSASELESIRNVMKENGEDVACGLCFVEDRRQLLGEIGQLFIDGVRGKNVEDTKLSDKENAKQVNALDKLRASGDKYIPSLYDLLTLDGMKKLRKEHPAVAQAFIEFNAARGMQAGRLFNAYSAYHRDILKFKPKKVKSINDNGGLRIFSFSDFEAHHLIDLVQVITDCAAKGIKIQGYTKVPEFAKAVKDTGAKINRSLIAKSKGLVDADYVPKEGEAVSPNVINGKRLLFDTIEGINVNDPNFFDSTDSKNVGNILVGISDEHIKHAMLDPYVDYIIPFHSGLSEAIRNQKGIGDWTNYKLSQLEKVIGENGKMKNADKHGINIYTDVLDRAEELIGKPITNAKEFQTAFFKACEENGWIPRFYQFVERTKAGKFKYTKGYEKLLIDFKLFDKNGKILPQEAVKPIFDVDFMKTILDDYVKGEKAKAPNDALYEKIKDGLGLNQPKFSVAENKKPEEEQTNVIFDAAKKKFGRTYDIREAGYVLPDGTMLDFSGRHELFGADDTFIKGRRTTDHRQIKDVAYEYDADGNESETGIETDMPDFIERGAIRIDDNAGTINLIVKPTREQRDVLRRLISRNDGDVTVDFGNGWDTDTSAEYYGGKAQRILGDIDRYFDEGIKPVGDEPMFSVGEEKAYKEAVDKGDTEAAQRMVTEAAKKAMPNTKVVDENGKPLVVYHGTDWNPYEEKTGDAVFKSGWFTSLEERANGFGVPVKVFIDIKNPIIGESEQIPEGLDLNNPSTFGEHDGYISYIDFPQNPTLSKLELLRIKNFNPDNYEEEAKRVLARKPRGRHYFSIIPRYPSQIKSAEPVTYDNNGEVIPLNKRFNSRNDDIRFSVGQDKEYAEAVRNGDTEKALEMLKEKADEQLNTIILPNDKDIDGFKYHLGAAPTKTFKRYAVLNVSPDGFKAAYAGNKQGTPIGVWLDAVNLDSYMSDLVQFDDGTFATYIKGDTGASAGTKFSNGKREEYGIKGSDRFLLERGGKHSSDLPNFSQMNIHQNENGEKVKSARDGALPHNKLIFEIEYGITDGGDLTEYVKENGRMMKGKNQGLANIEPNQYYDFKTNPNAVGNWGIGGTFRITRLVPHEEIVAKTEEYKQNAVDEANRLFESGEISEKDRDARIKAANAIILQKWVGGYHPEDFGLSVESVDAMAEEGKKSKVLDITYDDNGELIPLSERFNTERDDIRFSVGAEKRESAKDILDKWENQDGSEEYPYMYNSDLVEMVDNNRELTKDDKVALMVYRYNELMKEDFEEGRRDFSGGEADDLVENQLIPYLEELAKGNDIRFSLAADKPTFYSNAERAVEGIKQEKATPDQWLAMITKAGGLKAGEDKWMGLSDWLKSQDKKSLTKQEVLDFVRSNRVEVEDVNYEMASKESQEKLESFNNEFKKYVEQAKAQNEEDVAEWAFDRMVDDYGDDFRSAFEIQGLPNRQYELRPQFDIYDENITPAAQYYLGGGNPINSTRLQYTTEGLENKREIALVVPSIESWNESDHIHFGDAGEGRAIAWIRFGDAYTWNSDLVKKAEEAKQRSFAFEDEMAKKYGGEEWRDKLTPEEQAEMSRLNAEWFEATKEKNNSGNLEKVLVIDEIQSKRHQEGREKGYRDARLQKEYEEKRAAARKAYMEYLNRVGDIRAERGLGALSDAEIEEIKQKDGEAARLYSLYEEAAKELSEFENDNPNYEEKLRDGLVPDAPFDKNWHELAMKRMLRYAAENGYDKIAWTKGEQQAERYNITKIVSHVKRNDTQKSKQMGVRAFEVVVNGETQKVFVNEDGTIRTTTFFMDDMAGKPLSEVFGKELATAMMAMEDGQSANTGDMKVGGDGMKGFYDQILPRFMDKYGKKWGVKTQEIELPNVEEAGRTMWSVDVTPEMKESVMQGQPMFSLAEEEPASVEEITSHIDNIRKDNGVKGGAIHQVVNGSEQLEPLKRLIPDRAYERIENDFNDPDVAAVHIPQLNMIVLFANKMKNRLEGEMCWIHEQAHRFWHSIPEDVRERFATACMNKLRDDKPELLEWMEERYKPESILNEACSYYAETIVESIGLKGFFNVRFTGNEELCNFANALRDYLRNGKGEGTDNQPRRGGEEGEDAEVPVLGSTEGRNDQPEGEGSEGLAPAAPRFSIVDIKDRAIVRDRYERQIKSGTYQFREAMQDSMLSLRRMMESILKAEGKKVSVEEIPSNENPYLAENAMSSKSHAEQELYGTLLFNPLLDEVKRLKDEGASRDEITNYMMAKHGLERNRVMAQRAYEKYKQENPDGEKTLEDFRVDYAGLTGLTGEKNVTDAEAAAQSIVGLFELQYATDELWERTNACTKATLKKQYDSGLLNKEAYESIRDMYEYYIPLRGFDETTSDEVYAYLNHDAPAYSSTTKAAKGRKSVADDPLATIANMADASIMQGNRNMMKQEFYNFVMRHPSDLASVSEVWLKYDDVNDEWVVATADINENDSPEEVQRKTQEFEERMQMLAEAEPDNYKRSRDAKNIPFRTINGTLKEHQVMVKAGGKAYIITINGNPRVAQAVNGLTNPDTEVNGAVGKILKAGEYVTRQMSAFYTTRNPEFVLSNFIRDLVYSNSTMWVRESPAYAARFNMNFVRVNPKIIYDLIQKHNSGTLDMNNEMERAFYDFMMNGGETGYTNVQDIEKQKKLIKKYIKDGNQMVANAQTAWEIVGAKLDEINRSVENCARFAAFLTSRQSGRSIERSVYDAKEVSVNFNKKGAGSKFLDANGQTALGNAGAFISGLGRSGWVFWNASIQGVTNFGRLHKRHTAKAIAYDTALFALGALLAGYGGGDDEDYWKLPEYVRRNNICIKIPATHSFIKIPLGQELRAIYGMGELAASVLSGKEHMEDGEVGMAIISQLSQTMPLDLVEGGHFVIDKEGTHFGTLAPSWIKPVVENVENRNWMDMPIYDDSEWNKKKPEWQKANKRTNKWLVNFSKWTNELTGGDNVKRGWLNWNPSKLEHLIEGVFGGYSTTVNKVVKMYETFATDEQPFDWSNMLMASRVIAGADDEVESRKIKSEFYKYKDIHDSTDFLMKGYKKEAEKDESYNKKLEKLQQTRDYTIYNVIENYNKLLESLNDAKDKAEGEEAMYLKSQENMLRKEAVDLIQDIDNLTVEQVDSVIDETLKREFDSKGETQKAAGKLIAKQYGVSDSYGSPTTDGGEMYTRYRGYRDVVEDALLLAELTKAKNEGDKERADSIAYRRSDIRAKVNELTGVIEDDERVMEELRGLRKEALSELKIAGMRPKEQKNEPNAK